MNEQEFQDLIETGKTALGLTSDEYHIKVVVGEGNIVSLTFYSIDEFGNLDFEESWEWVVE